MRKLFAVLVFLACLPLLLVLAGCGGGNASSSNGSLELTIDWADRARVDLSTAQSVVVEVYAGADDNDITRPGVKRLSRQMVNRPDAGGTTPLKFANLPAGTVVYSLTAYSQPGGAGTPLGELAEPLTIASTPVARAVTLKPAAIARLVISPSAPAVLVGQQLQLRATAYDTAGKTVFVSAGRISWVSANPAVFTVNASTGLVRGVAAGRAKVKATESVSGISAGVDITVSTVAAGASPMVVFGYNELGMHCMNQDFSEFMILPPYNTLHAQVVDRSGEDPRIVTSGVQVQYSIPGNTFSVGKTNFWTFAPQLLGASLAPNVGLTGHTLAGSMTPVAGSNDWDVTGIPITPLTDKQVEDPYQLSAITVTSAGKVVATTRAVVPVSWEISCELCHNTPGISAATDILRKHDRLHGTTLESQKPVLCGKCHAQAALGLAGTPGVPSLSSAMHGSHAPRMGAANLAVSCYACHPGIRTKCQRDIHYTKGLTCASCHVSMTAVANPARRPWVDEPKCSDCHHVSGHEYEQAGTLFRNSQGHHGIHCTSCHGAPHAITPVERSITNNDNLQSIALQGYAGTINKCTVCHRAKPDDAFEHRFSGEGD